MNQNIQKPLVIELNEAKIELTQSINNVLRQRKLPCYLVEPILAELYSQVKEGARNELEAAKTQMNGAETTAP